MQLYKRFLFVKDYTCELGTIRKGTTLEYQNEVITVNGILVESNYYNVMKDLINRELTKPYYTKQIPFRSVNKIII